MFVYRINSYNEFLTHHARNRQRAIEHVNAINAYVPKVQEAFRIPGYSYTAKKQVDFVVDFQHSPGDGTVNWRESVCCPETYFNNRMRATFHLFDMEMDAYPDSKIYITEQITPIYDYFYRNYQHVTGSEFLGDKVPFGTCDDRGIRNETLCDISFPTGSFDIVICLDVLEHIPDYETAFKECARVLKPGGRMMWSVPFVPAAPNNIVRATVAGGQVKHHHPPEYHGNPLSEAGSLCFTHFGWEMLEQMKRAGFSNVYALGYQSLEFGYLGYEQFIFVAQK